MDRMSHYYSEEQEGDFREFVINARIRGFDFKFRCAGGIFSKSRIDNATKLLAENMVVHENDAVLDLGCGYGVLGIVAAKLTSNNVCLVDINKTATHFAGINAKENAEEPNRKRILVKQGNLYGPVKDLRFDVIVCNPPMSAGRRICYRIIEEGKEHLNKNGTLQIVARHAKGGSMLERKMKEIFGNVKTIAKKGGFRVYLAVNI